jgi:hypothetical protein
MQPYPTVVHWLAWNDLLPDVGFDCASVAEFSIQREYQISHGVHGMFKDVLLCGESFVPMALPKNDNNNKNDDEKLHSRIRGPSGDPNDIVCANCARLG